MKRILTALLIIISIIAIQAQQSIFVKQNNGTLDEIPLSQVQKITFSGNNMVLQKTDQATLSWATLDIQKYYFNDITQIESPNINDENVFIYPNPSNGNFNIKLFSDSPNYTEIELLDISGHIIETIISEKIESGYHIFNFQNNIESGNYLIKISNGNNLTVKKLIIIK